jgi:nucleoside-diphosphate-sugar epimerase
MQQHIVIGSGPVGSGVAEMLAQRGDSVTVITRSGTGPDHPRITKLAGDAGNVELLTRAATGAATIFNCANPPYHRWPIDWPPVHQAIMSAAETTGALIVMMDNLYGFGPGSSMPMREDGPQRATGEKGSVRARMATDLLSAHAAGRLRATLARASDFYGPRVLGAAMGDRVVPRVLKGKKVSVLGRIDVPHSASYMPDVVRTLVTIADDERAWGRPWHVPNAPAITQAQMVQAFATAAGTSVKVGSVPGAALAMMGLFNPTIKALKETTYQFTDPFVTDSTLTERTFGLSATPIAEGAASTVAWWRSHAAAPAVMA